MEQCCLESQVIGEVVLFGVSADPKLDACGVCRNRVDPQFGNCTQPASCLSPALIDMCGACLIPGRYLCPNFNSHYSY